MITRKTFLVRLAGGGLAFGLGGCGGGGSSGGGETQAPAAHACGAQVTVNHGHHLDVPFEDLDSTTDRTYDLAGAPDHMHTVSLSAAQLALLKAGQSVTVTSSVASAGPGHTHAVTVSCL